MTVMPRSEAEVAQVQKVSRSPVLPVHKVTLPSGAMRWEVRFRDEFGRNRKRPSFLTLRLSLLGARLLPGARRSRAPLRFRLLTLHCESSCASTCAAISGDVRALRRWIIDCVARPWLSAMFRSRSVTRG